MATPKSGKTAPKILDEVMLQYLASIGCKMSELAAAFKCSVDTLERNYAEVIRLGREDGKVSVRKMMFNQGSLGNSVALRYLITNILHEKVEEYPAKIEDKAQTELMDKVTNLSTNALLRIVKDYEDKAN